METHGLMRSIQHSVLLCFSQHQPIAPQSQAASPRMTFNPTQESNPCKCLDSCWLSEEQREQGERCLVACWRIADESVPQICEIRHRGCVVATQSRALERASGKTVAECKCQPIAAMTIAARKQCRALPLLHYHIHSG